MTSLAWNLRLGWLALAQCPTRAETIKMEYFALRVFRRAGLKAERETDLMQKFSSYTQRTSLQVKKKERGDLRINIWPHPQNSLNMMPYFRISCRSRIK